MLGKILVVNIWFVIKVKDFVKTGLINFRSREEMPSNPQLAFVCISSIVLDVVSSLIS